MGVNRDLKKATESYWGGKLSREELLSEGKRLRLDHWKIQKSAGIDIIPSNDFSFYDQVLDHIQMFGVGQSLQTSSEAIAKRKRRLSSTDMHTTNSTPLTSSSQWVGAFRSLPQMATLLSTSPAWYLAARSATK
jgi:hypothetical protein